MMNACICSSIGAPQEIRFCREHHAYRFGDQELTSVSKVIRKVLPTDYSMVGPAVLENARIRGERVDLHFMTYLSTGNVTIPPGERSDVVERLGRLIDWWDKSGLTAIGTQMIVFSKLDGIAGMLDITVDTREGKTTVVDLKCVSALQPSYKLQLGAYLNYGGADECAIIHVTKDKVRWVDYDAVKCRTSWNKCKDWYMEMNAL